MTITFPICNCHPDYNDPPLQCSSLRLPSCHDQEQEQHLRWHVPAARRQNGQVWNWQEQIGPGIALPGVYMARYGNARSRQGQVLHYQEQIWPGIALPGVDMAMFDIVRSRQGHVLHYQEYIWPGMAMSGVDRARYRIVRSRQGQVLHCQTYMEGLALMVISPTTWEFLPFFMSTL